MTSVVHSITFDCRRENGSGSVALADVEGDEPCVERSVAERA
jgi:hypothetical protein